MPPRVGSSTLVGDLVFGGALSPRGSRWLSFNATIDMGSLPSLGDRMAEVLHGRLVVRLGEAADLIIDRAKAKLQKKPPGVKTPDGNIYGYDTGLMHDTLVAKLVETTASALAGGEDGVYYDLESDEAWYWVFVEFGHLLRNGTWWPGYHFLTSTVIENEAMIRQRVRQAWGDTVVILAAQAAVSGAVDALDRVGLP
jgi:hypothetical protein